MEQMHWPLEVLSRSIQYKNLTGAAAHIGLSQPQLSRLIKKLEDEFEVVLLDRVTKRKSSWTSTAHRLAEIYQESSRRLQTSIVELQENFQPKQLRIATLEGLANFTLDFAEAIFENTNVALIELDILDQNELEEKF